MKNLTQLPAKLEAFPESAIQNRVTAWWDEEIKKYQTDPLRPKERKGTLYEVLPSIDSLAILQSMIIIEEILDQKVPSRFIKPGGYDSANQMLQHLMPQLRVLHETKLH